MSIRRILLCAAVFTLCLCMAAASAETLVFPAFYDWESAELNQESKVLVVRAKGAAGYTLVNVLGTPINDMTYRSARNRDSFVEVSVEEGVNVLGAVDASGRLVVPMMYGDIHYVSDRWLVGVVLEPATEEHYDYSTYGSTKNFFLVSRYDIYYWGNLVGSMGRTDYKSAYARGSYLFVSNVAGDYTAYNSAFVPSPVQVTSSREYVEDYRNDTITHAGSGMLAFTPGCSLTAFDVEKPVEIVNKALVDLAGNVLAPANTYRTVYSFYGDYAYVRDADGRYGIIDKNGMQALPCVLDQSLSYSGNTFAGGYELVVKDGVLCWARPYEGIVMTSDLSEGISYRRYGSFVTYQDMAGKTLLFTPLGKLPAVYADVHGTSRSGASLMVVQNNEGACGVIGLAGEEVIPVTSEFDSMYDLDVSYDGTVVLGDLGYRAPQRYVIYNIAYDATGLTVAAPAMAEGSWICPACGSVNDRNFCPECGTARPVV